MENNWYEDVKMNYGYAFLGLTKGGIGWSRMRYLGPAGPCKSLHFHRSTFFQMGLKSWKMDWWPLPHCWDLISPYQDVHGSLKKHCRHRPLDDWIFRNIEMLSDLVCGYWFKVYQGTWHLNRKLWGKHGVHGLAVAASECHGVRDNRKKSAFWKRGSWSGRCWSLLENMKIWMVAFSII